jgi:hypothetical protein
MKLAPPARPLRRRLVMRVLEARFYPQNKGEDDFIVVAHVVWEKDGAGDAPTVQPAASLLEEADAPATMLAKLHFLVVSAAPETFARLQALKSQFWSFVEVAPPLAPATDSH